MPTPTDSPAGSDQPTRAHLHRRLDRLGASLVGARLNGTFLHSANLSDTLLVGSELFSADLTDANLTGADLSSAVLDRAVLHRIHYDEFTRWPAGFAPPTSAEWWLPDEYWD